MLDPWVRAFAHRWRLPVSARTELQQVVDGIFTGKISDPQQNTRPAESTPSDRKDTSHQIDDTGRYKDLNRLAMGGMGEIRRVWDVRLNRTIAMKVLRPEYAKREDLVLRFVEEAEATAQLEHPGIIPIYDVGHLDDGRPYFTMKEIKGRTLSDVIQELHESCNDDWHKTPSGWTFQRLINTFQDICEALAFAHSKGVTHRDIKPNNIMVGAFGEVVVMDWGLAKIQGVPQQLITIESRATVTQVVTNRSQKPKYITRSGSVAGTPNYMPPEQARGEGKKVGAWSDVYALGALLYEILCDRAPFEGDDLEGVVSQVLAGPPPDPIPSFRDKSKDLSVHIESPLIAICKKAMAREISDRYMDASTLAEAIEGWLEGVRSREQALNLVGRADALEPNMHNLRHEVATLRAKARKMLASLPSNGPTEEKRHAWSLQDKASELESEWHKQQANYVNLLHSALTAHPNLREAGRRLEALVDGPQTSGTGNGSVSINTAPEGASVIIQRIQIIDRRRVPVTMEHPPLHTPLLRHVLSTGTYRFVFHHPNVATVSQWIDLRAGSHWLNAPPGRGRARPLSMPTNAEIPQGCVFIPAGWTWTGDSDPFVGNPQRRVWVGAMFFDKFPTTNARYQVFLDDHPGRADLWPEGWAGGKAPVNTTADMPVCGVRWVQVVTYSRWLSARTGLTWSIPREREWERAARGVDRRLFPWGNRSQPGWANVRQARCKSQGNKPVNSFPLDVSPWGVRGLAGNVADWVRSDGVNSESVPEVDRWWRGGDCDSAPWYCRTTMRRSSADGPISCVGFRLVVRRN